jgi:tripartite ATP-independent transporter DctM subunit
MISITITALIVLLLLGVPICYAIGFAGVLGLYFGTDMPLLMIVQRFFAGLNSFSLMAVPLFILAGAIMAKGGISRRIVNFAGACLSWLPGGIGCTCVGANMIFAGISGSGAAAVSAVGSITAPEMLKKGYSHGFTAALIGGGGSLGPVIPPSVDMIVFASITGMSVGRMFLGGILPGAMIGIMLMIYCFIYAKKTRIDYGGKFVLINVWTTLKDAIWALIMPLIIIGGVIFGIFTATEAGGIACVYGLIVSVFVYREITLRELIVVFRTATVNMCQVMMIIGMSNIFSYILGLANVGDSIVDFMLGISENPLALMIMVEILMIIIGCFMESLAAMPIILPIVYPMFAAMGVNLTQFGVVFCLATVLGGLTPPVGIYLFLSMTIAKAKMAETVVPHLLIVISIILTVITLGLFFPIIPSLIPNILMGPM